VLVAAACAGPDDEVPAGRIFVRLGSERTGIDLENAFVADHANRHLYVHGYAGGGVTVGDVDGDGRPDVFLSGQARPSALYRQVGPLRFEDVTESSGIGAVESWDAGASFADVDDDGDLDLYVCSYSAPNRLYVNDGTGRFEEAADAVGLSYSGASLMAAFADYDNDGDLDVYLLTNRIYDPVGKARTPRVVRRDDGLGLEAGFESTHAIQQRPMGNPLDGFSGETEPFIVQAGERDRLYRNDGGVFTDVSESAGLWDVEGVTRGGFEPGLAATWWDYNHDGLPDLYVSNDYWDPDRLYRNNGDGTFTDVLPQSTTMMPWFSMGADLADVDGDGLMDFLAADMAATTHFMQKVSMGEMDDSLWFLVSAEPRQYMRNMLFVSTGTERFMEAAQSAKLANSDWTWSVKFGDLDCDGRPDVFFTNGSMNQSFNPDYLARQRFQTERLSRMRGITQAQLEAAQWRLLMDQEPRREANLAFRNVSHGPGADHKIKFERADEWGLADVGFSFGAALADLDRDGDLDVITNNMDESAGVYENTQTGHSGVVIRLIGAKSNQWGIGALVTARIGAHEQTEYLTLSRGFMSTNEPVIHFGLGKAGEIDELTVRWPSGRVQSLRGLEAGRTHEVREPEGESRSEPMQAKMPHRPLVREAGVEAGLDDAASERLFNDYATQPLLPWKLSQLGPGLALADIDGDGDDDLFMGGPAGTPGRLYLSKNGRFERRAGPWHAAAESEDMGIVWLDADVDGDFDLFVASGGVEHDRGDESLRDRLYVNEGGRFVLSDNAVPDAREPSTCVSTFDFDGDDDLDLFVGAGAIKDSYPLHGRSRLLRNDRGSFVDVTDEAAPGLAEIGLVRGAMWTCGGERPALVLATDWGVLEVFELNGGRLSRQTESLGLAASRGWWNGVSSVDLDGDGRLDLLATNMGLNTKYKADASHPLTMFFGDLDGSGRNHLVEAKVSGDTLLPVRGLSCSSDAMPVVRQRFPTFESFALANLEEIYTKECLEAAAKYEVNELESIGMLRSSGGLAPASLPWLAQMSPAFAARGIDLDGDGSEEIVLAQNWYTPQPETSRWSGGLGAVLAREGDAWRGMRADQSGIVAPGGCKALVVTDVDGNGSPDVIMSQNDDRPLVFLGTADGERYVRVRLRGPAGNISGVGAVVILTEADGSKQVREVTAGDAYLSQSSSSLWFGVGDDGFVGCRLDVRWSDGRVSGASVESRDVVVTGP